MIMKFFKVIFVVFWGMATLGLCKSLADSAGAIPRPKGLAYGGIPYGSVSGQLSLYFGDYKPIIVPNKVPGNEVQLL